MDIHRHFWNMHYHQLRPKSILLYQTCMQGEMNYWNNKHYITVCFDKLEPYKFHLTKLRDILYALNLAFKIKKKKKSDGLMLHVLFV